MAAYQLFFRNEEVPTIGLRVARTGWKRIKFNAPEMNERIEQYLGRKAKWFPPTPTAGALGYDGCGMLDHLNEHMEASFHLRRDTLRRALLSFSFLQQDLDQLRSRSEFWMQIGCSATHQFIGGVVPETFKKRLLKLSKPQTDAVESSMRAVWRSVSEGPLRKYASHCYLRIRDDGRFELGCFGDACDVSIYPDSDPEFSCHNLDTPEQQATLLTGVIALVNAVQKR